MKTGGAHRFGSIFHHFLIFYGPNNQSIIAIIVISACKISADFHESKNHKVKKAIRTRIIPTEKKVPEETTASRTDRT